MSDSVREKDERLLSRYLDGELGSRQQRALEKRLASGDEELQRALDQLRMVREQVREFFREDLDKCAAEHGNVDVWSEVSKRLQSPEVKKRSLSEIIAGFGERFFVLRPSVLAAAGVVCLVFVVVRTGLEDSSQPPKPYAALPDTKKEDKEVVKVVSLPRETSSLMARRAEPLLFEEKRQTKPDVPVMPASINVESPGRDSLRSRSLSRIGRAKTRVIERTMTARIGSPGAHFDWIKSDRNFKIFPPAKNNAPPVIWISDQRRTSR